jgi:ABC-type transporter Mla subunit MlaD
LAEVKSSEAGTSTVKVTVTSPGQFNDSFGIVNGVARSGAKAGISSSSLTINFERTSSSLTSLDAAQEAADAANAATDAANAAAEGTAAATTAAQNAADAVAALSSQVSELVASLKKQILSLSALIAKIQTKLNS